MSRTSNWSRYAALAIRVSVVSACLVGIWESWKFNRSERLYFRYTADSIRAAIRVEPDCWWCYIPLAQKDESHAEELLRTSLRLNPYNSDAAIDLGLRYEADGDFQRAESLLLQSFEVDRTYAPRWSLANFYFRRDNLPVFWIWVRRATEMPAEDIGALFELCWRASPNAKTVEANIDEDNPNVDRQLVKFLLNKDQAAAAVHPVLKFISIVSRERDGWLGDSDQWLFFNVLEKLIAANDAADATMLWRGLIAQHWIVADTSVPNNPQFARDPLPVKFDWHFSSYSGLHSWPGSAGLETEFAGQEPENCTVAEQIVSLPPGTYRLESSYHTRGIAPGTGIRWEIADPKSDAVLANSPSLSSDSPAKLSFSFSVKPGSPFLRLQVAYHRAPGTTRATGTLVVTSIQIQPAT
jgi:hypothetical protein